MFIDVKKADRELRFSQDFVDFAFAESGRISESKTVTLFNKFPFSVDVDWALLNVLNNTTGQWVKNPYRVRPDKATIDANG